MANMSELIRALVESNPDITPQAIIVFVEAIEKTQKIKLAKKREDTKNRVRKFRAKETSNACNALHALPSVTCVTPPSLSFSPSPVSPHTPLITPTPKSLSTHISFEKSLIEENLNRLFERFWEYYGPIGNKEPARKAFKKIKGVDHEDIIAGIARYKAQCQANGTDSKFIKHASTWLNARGWEDEYPISPNPVGSSKVIDSSRNVTTDTAGNANLNRALSALFKAGNDSEHV